MTIVGPKGGVDLDTGNRVHKRIPTGIDDRSILYKSILSLCRTLCSVLFDLKVFGRERMPCDGGVLVVANHQSFLDPIILCVQIRRPFSFLAKSGLFTVPVLGPLIRRLRAFPVHQGAGDIAAVRETLARLKEGHVLSMFPEGSRSSDGQLAPLEGGVGLIVRRAGVAVLPAYIEGSFKAWPRGKAIFQRARVRVQYGYPLQVAGLRPAAIVKKIDESLRELRDELHAKIRRIDVDL